MKQGEFLDQRTEKIESFKYPYVHTLKVKRGKKVSVAKAVYENKD